MKITMKLLALLLTYGSLYAASSQVVPSRLPPLPPGQVSKVALTNVQAAIKTILMMDVSSTITAGGNNAEKIAYHFRALADVFAAMPTNGTFSVEHLRSELNRFPSPIEIDLSGSRTLILSLYERNYDYRGRSDVQPLEFLSQIAKTFHEAIREGIRQGGKANVL